ncbi:hypothetical protein Vafri_11522 [Volvox africanus]|nr:hypothetical protein Vafri_11522 [Volvox africanus]
MSNEVNTEGRWPCGGFGSAAALTEGEYQHLLQCTRRNLIVLIRQPLSYSPPRRRQTTAGAHDSGGRECFGRYRHTHLQWRWRRGADDPGVDGWSREGGGNQAAHAGGVGGGSVGAIPESVLVLAGGVGYILESVRRCGLRRQRFLDAQDVSYVALSETITSSDVRFFLAFVPRVGKPDNPCNLGGDDGGSSGQLTVPYENLLPRMRLRHLTAIYSELVGKT